MSIDTDLIRRNANAAFRPDRSRVAVDAEPVFTDIMALCDEVDRLRVELPTLVEEGWWHPNVVSGKVHDHNHRQPQTMHRLCEPVYTNRHPAEPNP